MEIEVNIDGKELMLLLDLVKKEIFDLVCVYNSERDERLQQMQELEKKLILILKCGGIEDNEFVS